MSGDGYTNHCPNCLWSLHVDVWPGDRSASCGAPMEPIQLLYERDNFVLVHRCIACSAVRRCRTRTEDDLSAFGLNPP